MLARTQIEISCEHFDGGQALSALIFFHRDAGYLFDQKHRVIARTWVGKDEKGFNLMLQALPLDGKVVLRQYEAQPGEIRTAPASKPRRKAPRQLEQA